MGRPDSKHSLQLSRIRPSLITLGNYALTLVENGNPYKELPPPLSLPEGMTRPMRPLIITARAAALIRVDMQARMLVI